MRIRTAYGWIIIGQGYILIDNGQGVERIEHPRIAGAAPWNALAHPAHADDAVAEAVGVAIG